MSVLSPSYWESDVYWRHNNKHFAERAPQNGGKQLIWRNYVTVTLCIDAISSPMSTFLIACHLPGFQIDKPNWHRHRQWACHSPTGTGTGGERHLKEQRWSATSITKGVINLLYYLYYYYCCYWYYYCYYCFITLLLLFNNNNNNDNNSECLYEES